MVLRGLLVHVNYYASQNNFLNTTKCFLNISEIPLNVPYFCFENEPIFKHRLPSINYIRSNFVSDIHVHFQNV